MITNYVKENFWKHTVQVFSFVKLDCLFFPLFFNLDQYKGMQNVVIGVYLLYQSNLYTFQYFYAKCYSIIFFY